MSAVVPPPPPTTEEDERRVGRMRNPRIRAAFIDVSGTLLVGERAVPGAISACRRLFRRVGEDGVDLRVLLLTNATLVSSERLLSTLREAGFDETAMPGSGSELLMTSVVAARRYLLDNGLRPLCLVEDELLETDLRDVVDDDVRGDPNCVLVGLAPSKLNYENLNRAYRLLLRWREEDDDDDDDDKDKDAPSSSSSSSSSSSESRPPRLIALHRSTRYRDADGAMSLGPGAFVSLLEGAYSSSYGRGGGKSSSSIAAARVIGKPSIDFYRAALSHLGVADPRDAIMVGDDVVGDVGGALDAGFGSAILVRTGKYVTGDEDGDIVPTLTVDSIVEAVDYICSNTG